MTIKSKLLTSAAALTLVSGAAFAEGETLQTDAEITTETAVTAEAGATDAYAPGWNENLDTNYAPIADRQIAELIGMNVVTEAGDDVGEVDNFVLMEDKLQAVVGVGGFLGLGEHHVALALSDLTYEGDRLVIPFTASELEAMPQYTEELDATALAETDTLRTRGDVTAPALDGENLADAGAANLEEDDSELMQMADGDIESDADEAAAPTGEDVAAAEEAAGDEDTMTEDVAEAEKGEIEQEAEELAAEADAAVEEGAEAVAEAGADAEAAVEESAEEVAEAADATGDAIAEGAENVAQATENAAQETADWLAKFGEVAEWTTADIQGKNVATASGEVIGEIDDLGTQNDKLMAVVGIGGFLGLGEHDVALEISEMSWDGEKFVVDGYSEDDLKGMAEYDPETLQPLQADVTLRSQANL